MSIPQNKRGEKQLCSGGTDILGMELHLAEDLAFCRWVCTGPDHATMQMPPSARLGP